MWEREGGAWPQPRRRASAPLEGAPPLRSCRELGREGEREERGGREGGRDGGRERTRRRSRRRTTARTRREAAAASAVAVRRPTPSWPCRRRGRGKTDGERGRKNQGEADAVYIFVSPDSNEKLK